MTPKDREKFAKDILLKLSLCNYGFQVEENSYDSSGYTYQEAKNTRAIKELTVRLNLWKATGREDKGIIDYPEAKRVIHYTLHPTSVGRCKVNLLKK